jgi:hypothetical protein
MKEATPEEWRPVLGYEGLNEVSSIGRVRSLPRMTASGVHGGRIFRPRTDRYGYLQVRLSRDGKGVPRTVHQLVCEAWHGPKPDGLQVRHLDGDQLNNTPGNLKWGTAEENARDILRHGRHPQANKTHCPQGHPYDDGNVRLDENGWRKCRVCLSERQKRYYDEHCEDLKAAERERHQRARARRTPEEHAAELERDRARQTPWRERKRQEVNAERELQGLPPLVKNSNKTHCPKGHPYDEENTYVVPKTGMRQCKICRRETMKRYFEQKQQKRDDAA